jgi:hypothetical protein
MGEKRAPATINEAQLARQRAFTLLFHAYADARRAVEYLRYKERDAASIAPALYVGRAGREGTTRRRRVVLGRVETELESAETLVGAEPERGPPGEGVDAVVAGEPSCFVAAMRRDRLPSPVRSRRWPGSFNAIPSCWRAPPQCSPSAESREPSTMRLHSRSASPAIQWLGRTAFAAKETQRTGWHDAESEHQEETPCSLSPVIEVLGGTG